MEELIDISESDESYWRVSKSEEGSAVRFILKKLLPRAWKKYSRKHYSRLFGFEKLTYEDIVKRFKKSNVSIDLRWSDHYITYEVNLTDYAPINPKIKKRGIYFNIYKNTNSNGDLFVDMDFWEATTDEDGERFNLSQKMNEDVEQKFDPNRNISRVEELEALQYIKNIIIPFVVKKWNSSGKQFEKITEKEVLDNLKKMSHYRESKALWSDWDLIYYGSLLPNPSIYSKEIQPTKDPDNQFKIKFWFYITKEGQDAGKLKVGGSNSIAQEIPKFVVGQKLINESISNRENRYTISKTEESQAINLILRHFIPADIREYNRECRLQERPEDQIKDNEIKKNLKKIVALSESKQYRLLIPNKVDFLYIITKEMHRTEDGIVVDGSLLVGRKGLNPSDEEVWQWFNVETFNSQKHRFEPDKNIFENSTEPISRIISKVDEKQALHIIRRYLIPRLVKVYNFVAGVSGKPLIEDGEIVNALTKSDNKPDHKYLKFQIPGKILKFYTISRYPSRLDSRETTDGELVVGEEGNFEGDKWKWYDVENFKGRHYIHWKRAEEDALYDKGLSESKEESITKVEEQQGINVINKFLIPFQIERHNLREKLYHHNKNLITIEGLGKLTKILNNPKTKEYVIRLNSDKFVEFHFVLTKERHEDDDDRHEPPSHFRIGMYDGWAFFDPGIRWFTIDDPMLKHLPSEIDLEHRTKTGKEYIRESSEELPKISKVEEANALNYYKKVLLPQDVNNFNLFIERANPSFYQKFVGVRQVTLEEAFSNLRKIRKGSGEPFYDSEIIIYESIIYKLNDNRDTHYDSERHVKFRLTIAKEIKDNNEILIVRSWHTFNPLEHKEYLTENKEEDPNKLTRLEEAEALNYISRVLIPAVVNDWNKRYISTDQPADANAVRAGITKFTRHFYSHPPQEDTILYKAPSPNRSSPFLFQIKKQNGTIHVGYNHAFLSGLRFFRLGEPVDESLNKI